VNTWNNGFTLTEALLGLSAFCVLATLLPLLFQLLLGIDRADPRLQEMQWEVFTSQIKKEIRMSQKIEPQSTRLLLTKDSNIILYELFGTNLRRRFNFTGNEILLQNVNSIRFTSIKNGVGIEIEDMWKNKYAFQVHSFIQLGKSNEFE
jgi:competence protein ComGF